MSIISAIAPRVKSTRPARPFGLGILEPVSASQTSPAELARTLREMIESAEAALTPRNPAPRPEPVVETPAPAPKATASSKPSREDAAWHFGRTLGRDGELAAPCPHWPASVCDAFERGLVLHQALILG